MKKKRARIVEAVVVAAIFTLLLIVVFPRFLHMQTLGKVAAAKKDVSAIMQAMESYRLDFGGESVQSVLAHREYRRENTFYTEITTLADDEPVILSPDVLTPYLKEMPVPRLPEQIVGNPQTYGPMYIVGRKRIRLRHPSFYGKEAAEALFWFTFYEDMYKAEYLGVAHGPLFVYDQDKFTQHGFDGSRQYAQYDPSNGLLSHGYIVSQWDPHPQAPPPPTPTLLIPPVYWRPEIHELEANLTVAPTPAVMSDATALIQYQQNRISSLEVVYSGDYVGNRNFNRINRVDAILGRLPDTLTVRDIDHYFALRDKPQADPIEFSYAYAGKEKQRKTFHSPRLTYEPWEVIQDRIVNNNDFTQMEYPEKSAHLFTLEKEDTYFYEYQIQPIWIVFPLNDFPKSASLSWEPQSDGRIRIRWKAPSSNNNPSLFSSIDAIIDPAIGYLPRKSIYVMRQLFENPLSSNSSAVQAIKSLSVWYSELEDYKVIDGVYFPTRMKIGKWKQIREEESSPNPPPGYRPGFEIPDVIGGAPIPEFCEQWNLTLLRAAVNQPIGAKMFSPDLPEGYKLYDHRK